jgi:Fe2+ transport system protein FeoA
MTSNATQSHSLDEVKTGNHAIFQTNNAERAVSSWLGSLGFTPGVDIEMTQNYGHGPLVVTVRGTRVALGRQEAKSIIVVEGQANDNLS